MISTKKLMKILNDNFGPPFLPKGFFVVEEGTGSSIGIRVRDRDLMIDRDGNSLGAGTNVGTGRAWEIKKRR